MQRRRTLKRGIGPRDPDSKARVQPRGVCPNCGLGLWDGGAPNVREFPLICRSCEQPYSLERAEADYGE